MVEVKCSSAMTAMLENSNLAYTDEVTAGIT